MLNSDWIAASISLKKHLGLDWKPKTVKIADIQSGKEAVPSNSTPSPSVSSKNVNPSLSSAVASSPKKKKKGNTTKINPKQVKAKEDGSSDEDEDEDEILLPIISTAQFKQQKKEPKKTVSQAFVSSILVEEALSAESNQQPLDLSDPNLYAEDGVEVPLATIDWRPVEKRTKKKK
jgi:hypothetical protein